MEKYPENVGRLHLLDAIRGFAVINMIIYHFLWDLVYLCSVSISWYSGAVGTVWQQLICMSFILLSGFCSLMGRKTVKRGLVVFAGGALVSAVTVLIMPENRVVFGVLTLIGSCMLLVGAMKRVIEKIPPAAGLTVSAALFVLLRNITDGYFAPYIFGIRLPRCLYRNYLTAFFGMPGDGFFSTDYFPLLPWLFLYLCGVFIYMICKPRLQSAGLLKKKVPVLDFIGRHSLIIYLLHQPILYAVCMLFFM